MNNWTADDIPDQTGRVILVTGANSGLGLVTARELAAHGAYVLMACRDVERGRAVRDEQVPGGDDHSEVRELDLADLASVHRFCDSISGWRIEAVVNNAGVMNTPLQRTAQGHEMQFGTNVLGHFVLARRLAEQVTDRFVWLGSLAHKGGHLDFTDLDWNRRRYNSWRAYSDSKLACIMLAYEQQRRFEAGGSHRLALAAHPGLSSSNLFRAHGRNSAPILAKLAGAAKVMQPVEVGALPQLYATTMPDLPGGAYIGPSRRFGLAGSPGPVESSAAGHSREAAATLWKRCEEMTR